MTDTRCKVGGAQQSLAHRLALADASARAQVEREALTDLVSRLTNLLDANAAARERLRELQQTSSALCTTTRLRRKRWSRQRQSEAMSLTTIDDLHRQFADTGDAVLRDRLVEAHAPLAYGLASRFVHRGEPIDDLQQVALLALVKAVERFEPSRGLQFSTFATPTVLGELKRHFRDRAWFIRLPRRLHDRYLAVQRARDDLAQELGRSPTVPELAARAGATVEEVLETVEAADARGLPSLDSPVPGQDGRDLVATLGGTDDRLAHVDQRATLERLLGRLSPEEREVLRLRFFEEMTQVQIAKKLDTNQMHVSRLLGRSLRRLRALADEK